MNEACITCERKKNVEVWSGNYVCTWCRSFMLQCEALSILKLDISRRREMLYEIESKRGKESAEVLKQVIVALWKKKAGNNPAESHESK